MSAQVIVENPAQQPLQTPPIAYPYAQYSDDPDVGAFFTAYNQIALGYLQWFNNNCLGLYIGKSGALLDWIGTNLYGLPRPTIGTFTRRQWGSWGTAAYGEMPYAMQQLQESGTAQQVGDDIYQRYLTMWLYLGDGKQMSIDWIRRRVARFLYGAGGSDIATQDVQNVSITQPVLAPLGAFGTAFYGQLAYGTLSTTTQLARGLLEISVFPSSATSALQNFVQTGRVPFPFQVKFTMNIISGYLTDATGGPFILNQSTLG